LTHTFSYLTSDLAGNLTHIFSYLASDLTCGLTHIFSYLTSDLAGNLTYSSGNFTSDLTCGLNTLLDYRSRRLSALPDHGSCGPACSCSPCGKSTPGSGSSRNQGLDEFIQLVESLLKLLMVYIRRPITALWGELVEGYLIN